MSTIISSIPFFGKCLRTTPDYLYKKTDCIQDSKEYQRHQSLLSIAKKCEQLFQLAKETNTHDQIISLSQQLKNMFLLNVRQASDLETLQEEVLTIHNICKKHSLFRRQFLTDLTDIEACIQDLSSEKRKLMLDACWMFTDSASSFQR